AARAAGDRWPAGCASVGHLAVEDEAQRLTERLERGPGGGAGAPDLEVAFLRPPQAHAETQPLRVQHESTCGIDALGHRLLRDRGERAIQRPLERRKDRSEVEGQPQRGRLAQELPHPRGQRAWLFELGYLRA